MENIKKIIITDESLLSSKIESFKKSFKFNPNDDKMNDKILVISDFDYTLNNKFDYNTVKMLENSYSIYDPSVFGGNQEKYKKTRAELNAKYMKYEDDNSLPIELRKEKLYEWNKFAIDLMADEKFERKHVKIMVNNNKSRIFFKKYVKEFYEKLIKLNIPIILVSGGIKETIVEILNLLNIEGLDNYIERKRLLIIANEFKFDEKTKKCIGACEDIIYGYNKADHLKKLVDENFPNFENIFVFGDLVTDYQSTEKLKLNKDKNIIGFGFIHYSPDQVKKGIDISNDDNIKYYQKVFDVNLIIDEGYEYPLKILEEFKP